nr:hypothetical protein GCM10017745_45900 [Saccharothrix mutabilis subsp. capreolus]
MAFMAALVSEWAEVCAEPDGVDSGVPPVQAAAVVVAHNSRATLDRRFLIGDPPRVRVW